MRGKGRVRFFSSSSTADYSACWRTPRIKMKLQLLMNHSTIFDMEEGKGGGAETPLRNFNKSEERTPHY
jgi:hypothetical protein